MTGRVYDIWPAYGVGGLTAVATPQLVDGVLGYLAAPFVFVYVTYLTVQAAIGIAGYYDRRQEVTA